MRPNEQISLLLSQFYQTDDTFGGRDGHFSVLRFHLPLGEKSGVNDEVQSSSSHLLLNSDCAKSVSPSLMYTVVSSGSFKS